MHNFFFSHAFDVTVSVILCGLLLHSVDGVAVALRYSVSTRFTEMSYLRRSNFKLNPCEYCHWKALFLQLEFAN